MPKSLTSESTSTLETETDSTATTDQNVSENLKSIENNIINRQTGGNSERSRSGDDTGISIKKRIEDHLKNWDPLKDYKNKEKPTKDIADQKGGGVEEIVGEAVMIEDRYLTSEEMAQFQQQFQGGFPMTNIWQSYPQLVETSGDDIFTTPRLSKNNPKVGFQYPNQNPWFYSMKPDESKNITPRMQPPLNGQDLEVSEKLTKTITPPPPPSIIPSYPLHFSSYANNFADFPISSVIEEKIDEDNSKMKDEQEDKITALNKQLEQFEKENQGLKKELDEQRFRLNNLGPRYKYLEDNFEDFIKMKDEYTKLKNERRLEPKVKKSGEMCNQFVQTWSTTIMCPFCIETQEMIRSPQIQRILNFHGTETYCVSKADITDLKQKFDILKENILERERDYENRREKAELIHLTAQNFAYRKEITELEGKNRQSLHRVKALEGIIAKIYSKETASELTILEDQWVEQILNKYSKNTNQTVDKDENIEECTKIKIVNADKGNSGIKDERKFVNFKTHFH